MKVILTQDVRGKGKKGQMIEAAEGRVPVDTLFINAQIVDVYGQRVAPGSVAVKAVSYTHLRAHET